MQTETMNATETTDECPDDRQWWWSLNGADTFHGPFNSRSAAIANACVKLAEPVPVVREIFVGIVEFPVASTFVELAGFVDTIVEKLDEIAAENGYGEDGEVFMVCQRWDMDEAGHALTLALENWCDTYVFPQTGQWRPAADGDELVEIHVSPQASLLKETRLLSR